MKKILVALSGGVDSSVAAWLLQQQGYAVAGAYMKNWINEQNILGDCPWQQDIEDASHAAAMMGIDFEVVNFMRDYRERVVQNLVEGYSAGVTPNPDCLCNREMKFGLFLDYARREGFDGIATGHYALRHDTPAQVWEGRDKNKDQSYFLARVSREQLNPALFPLGSLYKQEVRAIAEKTGLPNAKKKDSQGICFIGQVRMSDFLEQYIPDNPGEIVSSDGVVLGEHRGLHRYTLGQRKGIGIPSNTDNKFYVVVGKEAETNRLVVAFEEPEMEPLWHTEIAITELNWLTTPPIEPVELLAKPRYRDPSTPVTFFPDANGGRLIFRYSQRALAAGQVCALYNGERLVGGGLYTTPYGKADNASLAARATSQCLSS